MDINEIKISEIKVYANNAKKHDKRQIANVAESIKRFGFVQPIVIDKDGVIVIGHCRYEAAKKLKMNEIPCVRVETLSDEDVQKLRLLDNKLNESEWDRDMLLEDIPLLDWDGFDIDWGLDIGKKQQVQISEDSVPEQQDVERRCKSGDIWQLGKHRLICGDSTDINVIDKLMNGEKADITITSPPYGMGRTAHLRKHLESGKSGRDGLSFYGSSTDDSKSWLNLMNNFYNAAQKAASVHFINVMMVADNKQSLVNFVATHSNDLVDIIVWNKHTCPPQIHEKVLNNGYEFVFVFDNEQNTRAIRFGDFKGTKSNYIETQKEQNQFADIHKAVYSIEFVSKILDICNCAHSAFDPFGGTGTTLIACEQLDRQCYMCELNEQYCDIILQRWENLTGEKAVLLEG